MQLIILTGMSGAGKTQALKKFEDIGYFCVDNLPVPFIDKFAELTASGNSEITKVAIGIDIRSGKSLSQLEQICLMVVFLLVLWSMLRWFTIFRNKSR